MTFHHEHKPGEMIERLDGDIMDIAILFAQFVVRVLGSILLLIGVILVLLAEDWRISLALGVYALVALVCFTVMRRRAVPFWEANRQARGRPVWLSRRTALRHGRYPQQRGCALRHAQSLPLCQSAARP